MKLNLGSYLYPLKDHWNVDIAKWEGVDQAFDLNKLPWPWRDRQWEHVRAIDILEHLGKLTKFQAVEELARITTIGGTVEVRVPCLHHWNALASLQHAHSFYFNSFDESYAQPWFSVQSIRAGLLGRTFPYKAGTRFILRLLSRLGIVETITFQLVRE